MSNPKKKFNFGGRQILLLGLVALVITAGYYRWTIESEQLSAAVPTVGEVASVEEQTENENNENGQNNSEGESEDISKMKQTRDSARSQSVEEWKKLMQASETSQENKKDAEKKIAMATENADKERKIETQVKAKGYDDCIAYVDESGVSVTVKGGEVDGNKVAQIKDIIVSETNVPVRNIKINAL